MNISEHLVEIIHKHLKCKHAFSLTGGGAMFLNDAFGNSKNLKCIYCHHEQAAAMAAVGYAKIHGIGACVTTTGCGATNALTGLLDAWQDNVPVIFISGQVKSKETTFLSKASLRGFGVQEFNIIPVVKSFTKAAYFIDSVKTYFDVINRLDQDLKGGRPGPVWIDIPMDIQSKQLDLDEAKDKVTLQSNDSSKYNHKLSVNEISLLKRNLSKASKPLLLVGNGVRLSQEGQGIEILEELVVRHSIPIVTTYLGVDFFQETNTNYFGTIGLKASRAANILVQNADLLICIGTRLATSVIGFEYDKFAPNAYMVVVDIDIEEHKKRTVTPHLFIKSDAFNFIQNMSSILQNYDFKTWLDSCKKVIDLLPVKEQESPEGSISIYDAVETVCNNCNQKDVIISDAGSAYYVTSIIFTKKESQRYITSGAQADMGFGVPASIGCCFAIGESHRSHVLTGDGSFQLNLQELQTIISYKLNLTIYVLNNNGYLSIRATQKSFFPGRECGTDSTNGISFPNLKKLCNAYGIEYRSFNSKVNLQNFMKSYKDNQGPLLIELICPKDETIIPRNITVKDKDGKLKSGALSNMAPILQEHQIRKLKEIGFKIE